MAELFDMKELEERVILVAVSTSDEDDTEASLDELEELADTAGATAIGRLVQNREKIHPGTYLGSGKIGELREMVWEMGATGVICDDELSPAQLRNLESALDTKVMDRTMFSRRMRRRAREKSRLSWHSCVTAQRAWSVCAVPCPVWAAVSVREDRVKRSWRWTAV